jgi:hypothetical protein
VESIVANSKGIYLENEIIKIARFSAESFCYYKSIDPDAGNFYMGKNEVEGQCADYALVFVIEWNKKYPENLAEIVAVNQEKGIKSGSYKVVKKITDEERIDLGIKYYKRNISQWMIPPKKIDGEECSVLFHPEIGFYQLEQSEIYEIKNHFGVDMVVNNSPHVWAKVGDIFVDLCWADIYNKCFIGKDIVMF